MAHCGSEEAAVALAGIDAANASVALCVAEGVLDLAELDLLECEEEHE